LQNKYYFILKCFASPMQSLFWYTHIFKSSPLSLNNHSVLLVERSDFIYLNNFCCMKASVIFENNFIQFLFLSNWYWIRLMLSFSILLNTEITSFINGNIIYALAFLIVLRSFRYTHVNNLGNISLLCLTELLSEEQVVNNAASNNAATKYVNLCSIVILRFLSSKRRFISI